MKSINILLVDDDDVDRMMIMRMLDSCDFESKVIETDTAQSGLDAFRNGKFDCVLLDYGLPGMNGSEVLEQMTNGSESGKAIIMLTGQGNEDIAAHVLKNGAKDYLAKGSMNTGALQRAILNAIEKTTLEHDLALQREKLEQSNQELEQFAYVASHDLQEPLRIITSFLQLLEKRYKGKLDEKADKYIHFAVDGAQRMQTMISSILELSRIGRRDSDISNFDAEDALTAAIGNLTIAIDESQSQITHDPLPQISGSINRITQLFQNLVGNAIKYRGDAAPEIHVTAEPILEGADENSTFSTSIQCQTVWRFAVIDNGMGMDQEFHDRAFLMFQQLQAREEGKGVGIGLALCKKIVETHRGRIWFESIQGEGTSFFFTLPGGDRSL